MAGWLIYVAALAATAGSSLDSGVAALAGDWDIYDSKGDRVGSSRIEAQAPGSMLYEVRKVGEDEPQPLWWENSEADGGWVQRFVGPAGKVRAFRPLGPSAGWPMVIGADVTLRDGTPAKFRVTMTDPSGGRSRRRLEISRDAGKSWSDVFDYEYRRK